MKDKVIIFGAGRMGRIAFYYYNTLCDIICFIDNNNDLFGTKINGLKVEKPTAIKRFRDFKVVIAVRESFIGEIEKQLANDYNISDVIIFSVYTEGKYLLRNNSTNICESSNIVIALRGGLGNQLFEYALYKFLARNKTNVLFDFLTLGYKTLIIKSVFPKSELPYCDQKVHDYFKNNKKLIISEPSIDNSKIIETNMEINKIEKGYLIGYWQTFRYAELVKEELKLDLEFNKIVNNNCLNYAYQMANSNSVSIHVRRGDYLLYEKIYGNICDVNYYTRAVAYIKKIRNNLKFFVFSDDISWVKNNLAIESASYVDSSMYKDWEDWYDMYLMTMCKYNIIANSTFSWWAAWLNKFNDKIVVAPKKWVNGVEFKDIYPDSWIKM